MDSVFAWIIVTCGAWYGGIRFLLKVVEEEEARKARHRDEMW